MTVTGTTVAEFLGQGDDTQVIALANTHASIVTELVRAYTRGKGFAADGQPYPDVASVITMATARVTVNPEQNKREQIGDYQVTPGTLYGWTLPELAVLHRYRVRATSESESSLL